MMKKYCWMMTCILLLTSCASSGVKTLHVNTDPKGAVVSMGEQTCQSPCDISVPEGEAYVLNIHKNGFENKVVRQFSEWEQSPWVLGVAMVALVGLIVTSPSPKDTTMTAVVAGFLESLLEPTDIDIDVTMKAGE